MFCNYHSAVEDLFNFTPSCSEACKLHHLAWVAGQPYDPAVLDCLGYSLVIWSTPLATSSVPRCSDIELAVLSLFLPTHYLSVQRGCHPLHATCLFSLLVLHPLQYQRTVLTFSRRPDGLLYGDTCHRSILPTSSELHPCL